MVLSLSGCESAVVGNRTSKQPAQDGPSAPAANQQPSVHAGSDLSIALGSPAVLNGTVQDDGLPNPPGVLATVWSKVSGPGTVGFADLRAVDTTASFSASGTYTLRLSASDDGGTTVIADETTVTVTAASSGGIATEANLKVAILGDSGTGSDFRAVLNLIAAEGADVVLHQGDFAYGSAATWQSDINSVLGSDFPYFGADGNHDNWGDYDDDFRRRLAANGVPILAGDAAPGLNDKYHVNFKGLSIVVIGESASAGAPFINAQLQGSTHIWKIVSWHKNQRQMNVGSKNSEMNWDVYNFSRQHGAIIVTGHEHSYHRTKTLSAMLTGSNSTPTGAFAIDPGFPERFNLGVKPGSTFVVVAGQGGQSLRDQWRCCDTLPCTEEATRDYLPDPGDDGEYPYGPVGDPNCNIWAVVYTTDQNGTRNQVSGAPLRPTTNGALFLEFNINGDPRQARGYAKSVHRNSTGQYDEIIDQFTIAAP